MHLRILSNSPFHVHALTVYKPLHYQLTSQMVNQLPHMHVCLLSILKVMPTKSNQETELIALLMQQTFQEEELEVDDSLD